MKNTLILYPVFALAAWTMMILMRVAQVRITSRLRPGEFKYGEAVTVPPHVSIPNRNYMNLLEVPLLFYVACLLLYVAGGASVVVGTLAWAYVGLRIVHSLVHLTYNNVMHRLGVFALSNVVLVGLWVCAWFTLSVR